MIKTITAGTTVLAALALPVASFAENPWRALDCPPGAELQHVTEHSDNHYSANFYTQAESCVDPLSDELHGEVRISNSRDGVVFLSTYHQGLKHGPEWTFHANDAVHGVFNYQRSRLHGPIEVYRVSGLPELTGYYANSRRVGVWRYFDENGRLQREQDFGRQPTLNH